MAIFNIWGVEVQIHSIHGPHGPILPQHPTTCSNIHTTTYRSRLERSSTEHGGSRQMGTTGQQLEVHTCERNNRSCSNSVQTVSTWDGTWDLQAAQQQVCHTIRNKKHRVPNKAAQANIWQQQLRGVILQLGIRALEVWERQQHNTTRPNQNCSPDERDIRPTATTPALECRSNTNIRRGTWNKATTALSRLHQQTGTSSVSTHAQGGPAPMDIGAVNKESTTKEKERSPTKEKERTRATKAEDMATETIKA